jgi:outer membrane protein
MPTNPTPRISNQGQAPYQPTQRSLKVGDSPILLFVVTSILFSGLIYLLIMQIFFRSKTAYVDSTKIFREYKGILMAKKEFQKKVDLAKSRMDTLSSTVKQDILNLEKYHSNPVKVKQYSDSMRYHKMQLGNYEQGMNKKLQEEEGRLTQTSVEKLNIFLKKYGKEHGYDMIFIANSTGTIAYAKEEYDITDAVVKEINQEYP